MRSISIFMRNWRVLAVAVAFCFLPLPGRAQVVVTDPTSLANDIYQFIEQNFQHIETLEQYGQQLKVSLENLENVKQNLDMVRKTFSVASGFFKDARILVDTYDNLQRIAGDVNQVMSEVQYYQNGGKLSPHKVYYAMRLAGEISGRAVDTWNFAKDQVMSQDNNLSLHERMMMLDEINKEFRRYHNLFKKVKKDIEEEAAEPEIAIGAGVTYDILTRRVPNGKPTEEEKDDIDEVVTASQAAVTASASADPSAPRPRVKRGAFQNNVISIVSYVITILAVLFFGWNFGVYNHGDRQRSDVLWKVGAGYLIMMVALSVLDNVFIFDL